MFFFITAYVALSIGGRGGGGFPVPYLCLVCAPILPSLGLLQKLSIACSGRHHMVPVLSVQLTAIVCRIDVYSPRYRSSIFYSCDFPLLCNK